MATLNPPTTAVRIVRLPDEFGRVRKGTLKFHFIHPKRDGQAVCDQRFDGLETATKEVAVLHPDDICKRCLGAMTASPTRAPSETSRDGFSTAWSAMGGM